VIGRYNRDSVVCDVVAEAKETTEGPNLSPFVKHRTHDIHPFTAL